MKTSKDFTPISIVLIVVLLLVVGCISFYLGKNSSSYKDIAVVTNNPNINTQQLPSSNKLFDFFDTFTADKNTGTPSIQFMYPEQHLILLSYPTSQETGSYAVYDYKNDLLYKGIGHTDYGSQNYPVAFLGVDKLLMFANCSDADDICSRFTVQDFNNKIIKTLMTDVPIHEVYPKYGKVITIDTNTKDSGRFNLNTETLELTPWHLPQ
ncbi:MAG: hypothetical protein WAV23_02320 [Minisyncoccia bacterium]